MRRFTNIPVLPHPQDCHNPRREPSPLRSLSIALFLLAVALTGTASVTVLDPGSYSIPRYWCPQSFTADRRYGYRPGGRWLLLRHSEVVATDPQPVRKLHRGNVVLVSACLNAGGILSRRICLCCVARRKSHSRGW